MKKEFLKGLNIADDIIDKILAEHGVTVAALKNDITQKDGVIKSQNEKISDLEKTDIEALKKDEFEKGKAEGTKELEKFKFNNSLNSKLKDFKVKDPKIIAGLIDTEKLKYENGEITGLEELLKPLQESHDYLFETAEKPPYFSKKADNSQSPTGDDTLRAAMGLSK